MVETGQEGGSPDLGVGKWKQEWKHSRELCVRYLWNMIEFPSTSRNYERSGDSALVLACFARVASVSKMDTERMVKRRSTKRHEPPVYRRASSLS